jgi:hypothetical protein
VERLRAPPVIGEAADAPGAFQPQANDFFIFRNLGKFLFQKPAILINIYNRW